MSLDVIAAWWGVAVAAVVGVGGIIVGAIGLHQAKEAKATADEASNLSRQANQHAEEANQIAREANEISRAIAARSQEQHDVDWEWEFDEQHDGSISIQNIGTNKALEVKIQFMFQGVTETNPAPMTVDGRETVRFEIEGLAEAIAAERKRRTPQPRTAGMTMGGPFVRPPGHPILPTPQTFRLRVKWLTELGTPKQHDSVSQNVLPE